MDDFIIYVDTSDIQPGQLEPLKAAVTDLVDFIDEKEPRLLAYNVYISDDGKQMTVIHIHPDSASLATHLDVAGPKFQKFADFIRLKGIDLYGEPDQEIVDRLQAKASTLGSGFVRVHSLYEGVGRPTIG